MVASVVDKRQFTLSSSVRESDAAPAKAGRPDFQYSLSPHLFKHSPSPLSDDDDSEEDDEEPSSESWKPALEKSRNADELDPPALDPRDAATSDCWIRRNPSLIRLTGKHPFNSEPPLDRLMNQGFITPASLHYVRNHGAVPKATWEGWTVEVSGLVKRPARFTMDELVREFPAQELPVTLVCAGNRRKEQNMVKKTVGFNWGAAAVSTSVWRGCRLRDVLRRCGVRKKGYVCFEGEEDLPAGGLGSKYGTSIRVEVAMDPARDVMLAYMQNGEVLSPDHGFPVRLIIPGFIGGRMVKWLRKIVMSGEESPSYYHYKDNRVLPSHVDADLANADPGWWHKPEYIINELNINSAITTPGHDEILPINTTTTLRPYTIKGYAYSGGGNKVTRVEVTLDGGETWLLCTLDHPEKPTRYGKYWCWCFWSVEVQVFDLLGTREIAVRAWDQTHNTQPERLVWNVMGMMNNCWFRVMVEVRQQHRGDIGLVFEHPTQPGNQSGGWMARNKHQENSQDRAVSKANTASSKKYCLTEVEKHSSEESAWIVVRGCVYDCTSFLKDHPGGSDSILINAGTDCTEEFDAIHSDEAKSMLETHRIGELNPTGPISATAATAATAAAASIPRPIALVPLEKIQCKLVSKTQISHDVRLFRFSLPSSDQVLGLPVGKHIFLCATVDGKLCIRAYTPTSAADEVGHFELLVRVYFKGVNPKFPKGGLMSQYLDSLPVGSTLGVKGPVGHMEYKGRGSFLVHGKPRFARRLAMVAGGTGITPIYQVMQAVMRDGGDETEMYLVYANRTEDDVLLKEELDGWAREHGERLKVWYVVSQCKRPEEWEYSVGWVEERVLREHLPLGGCGETLALVCGPPAMLESAVLPSLEKMNYDVKDSCLRF